MGYILRINGNFLVVSDSATSEEYIRSNRANTTFSVNLTDIVSFYFDSPIKTQFPTGENAFNFAFTDIIDYRTSLAFVSVTELKDYLSGNLLMLSSSDPLKEDKVNKQNSLDVDGTGVKYPTVDAVNSGLANITSGASTYVLKNTASSIGGGYLQLVDIANFTAGALATVSTSVTTSPTLLSVFATNLGYPNVTAIPVGLFEMHYDTQKVSGGQYYYTYFEIYKRVLAGTETLLYTSDITTQSNLNTIVQNSTSALITAPITLLSTDRLVVKIYGVMLTSSATIGLLFDNATNSRFTLPASIAPPVASGITVGTTPITSGTNTRVLFQNGGVVQQSANLLFNGNGLAIGGYDASTSRSLYVVPVAQTFGIDVEQYVANGIAGRFVANNSGTATALSLNAINGTTNNALYATNGNITVQNGSITVGNHTNGAKLDVKAGGALSTDLIQKWTSSTNAQLGKLTGDGALTLGTYTNPSTKLSIDNGASTGAYIGGLKGVYAVGNASGTAYGIDALGRSTASGGTSYGVYAIADGGAGAAVNYGIRGQASGAGSTNYAGYFDATSATTNYALYVQRGDMVFGVSPTLNKIGFWNATPIVQPTTSIASATLASLGGTALTDTDTFDGYTLKQIVKALRNAGLIA